MESAQPAATEWPRVVAGAIAGRDAVLKYRLYIFIAAAAFGVLGPQVCARPANSFEPAAAFGYEPFPSPTTTWP